MTKPEVNVPAINGKNNWSVWYDDEVMEAPSVEHFKPSFWNARDAMTGSAGGRRLAYFIEDNAELARAEALHMVLRHYYRGGLIAKLNEDLFVGWQVARSRAMQEFSLLADMYQAGLPVPKPYAALFSQHGLFYRSDILIERLPCDSDLYTALQKQPLSSSQWQQLGKIIAQFHQAGIYHSDLNCHNILIRQQGAHTDFWIIDFDKCKQRSQGKWQDENLARLLRSLNKEKQRHTSFQFSLQDWRHLMDGYHEIAS
ncbi:3-deoxy-D-manno-octulosonic acid kinase [Aliidiomarina minuta]|nr:3-deoxy-D-manno-octulosonic acid kinase [Aliidiomarina minuta]